MILCIIYHANCADGFGAAWAVRHALGADNVEFHAGVYSQPPPDVAGRDVVLVDFSYKRPVLEEMAAAARSITVLDHHQSAADDLAGLPLPVAYGPTGLAPADWGCVWTTAGYHPDAMHEWARQNNTWSLHALFDMDRSGAQIAWDFFHPGQPRPHMLDIIGDRDLGGGISRPPKILYTREAMTAIFSYPYDFDRWDQLAAECEDRHGLDKLLADGRAIDRKHFKDIAELVAVCQRRMVIGGHDVPVASLPYTLSSDAGHLMARGEPFAACYWDTADRRVFSLRSTDDGVDVQAVAVQYGGGGHVRAAGFQVPRDHDLARA